MPNDAIDGNVNVRLRADHQSIQSKSRDCWRNHLQVLSRVSFRRSVRKILWPFPLPMHKCACKIIQTTFPSSSLLRNFLLITEPSSFNSPAKQALQQRRAVWQRFCQQIQWHFGGDDTQRRRTESIYEMRRFHELTTLAQNRKSSEHLVCIERAFSVLFEDSNSLAAVHFDTFLPVFTLKVNQVSIIIKIKSTLFTTVLRPSKLLRLRLELQSHYN